MSRREGVGGRFHRHICGCGLDWVCSKPDCRNSDDCTACEIQQQDDFFRARGDSAEQLEIPELQS